MNIPRQYVVDEHDQRIAVQLDLNIFAEIEEVLENYALYRVMQNADADDPLDIDAARAHYEALEKSH